MTEQKWIDPASCSHRTTYVGLVRTPSGLHRRVLRRDHLDTERPWAYYPSPEEGGPKCVADDAVSELEEVDPFYPHRLQEVRSDLDRAHEEIVMLNRKLRNTNNVISAIGEKLGKGGEEKEDPPTVKLIRQIVQEELRKASRQLNGLTITHKEGS